MLQNSKCGNNAAIGTKEIREELKEYFIRQWFWVVLQLRFHVYRR